MNQSDLSRYDQKLEHILRTSARIFAEKSYHSTSMREIARATGVSLAGLYHYCKSKEELLFLIQDHCFGRVLERLEERIKDVDDPFAIASTPHTRPMTGSVLRLMWRVRSGLIAFHALPRSSLRNRYCAAK